MERKMKLDNVVKIVTTDRKYNQLLAMGYKVVEEEATTKKPSSGRGSKPKASEKAGAESTNDDNVNVEESGEATTEGEAEASDGDVTPEGESDAAADAKAKDNSDKKK